MSSIWQGSFNFQFDIFGLTRPGIDITNPADVFPFKISKFLLQTTVTKLKRLVMSGIQLRTTKLKVKDIYQITSNWKDFKVCNDSITPG